MSDTHTGETRAVGFEGVTPILRVRSVAESIAYYVQTLGFTLDFHEGPYGNVLRLGSEPHEDQPIGEWLDMRGDVWMRSGDVWTRVEPG